jgi:hypothetical protein
MRMVESLPIDALRVLGQMTPDCGRQIGIRLIRHIHFSPNCRSLRLTQVKAVTIRIGVVSFSP